MRSTRRDTPREFLGTRSGALIVLEVGVAAGAAQAGRKGNALHWNEEPGDDRTPPQRSTIRPEGIAAEIRRRRAQQAPPVPERPRPSGVASTGQVPIARTRSTGAGPTGTEPIPVVRQVPAAPARPFEPQDPARRRLRVEPLAAPAPLTRREALRSSAPASRAASPAPLARPELERSDAPAAGAPQRPAPSRPADLAPARPAPQPLRSPVPVRTRPASAPLTATPSAAAAPAARPSSPAPAPRPTAHIVPPPPVTIDPEPAEPGRRRPVRGVLAALAAFGLLTVFALPSLAGESAGAPPVLGVHTGDDLQQFQVGHVDGSDAHADGMTGEMPVAAAPSWVVPLRGELRDGFGPRLQQPVAGVNLFHRGQDIGGGCGAPIHAAASGTVESAGWWGTYGNWTLIDHGDGVETGYAHQARMLVRAGQHVTVGQVIGYEGTTGASTGCHLHLEVHLGGVAVNPVPFFKAKGIPLGP